METPVGQTDTGQPEVGMLTITVVYLNEFDYFSDPVNLALNAMFSH